MRPSGPNNSRYFKTRSEAKAFIEGMEAVQSPDVEVTDMTLCTDCQEFFVVWWVDYRQVKEGTDG